MLGLLVLVAAVGCSSTPTTAKKEKDNVVKSNGHHEHGEGPHGGVIFDLGKYHAEFKPDHGKKEATLYILGDDEKTAVPIAVDKLELSVKETKAENGKVVPAFTVELKASPQKDDPSGKSSRFVGQHDSFANEADFAGTVVGKVDGKPIDGSFEEKEHKK